MRGYNESTTVITTSTFGLSVEHDGVSSGIQALLETAGRKAEERAQLDLAKWAGSPYRSLRASFNQSKGVVGEAVAASLFASMGLSVSDASTVVNGTQVSTRGHDLDVQGLNRVEVKLATEGLESRVVFGAIRPTEADQVILLGVTPARVHAWLVPAGDFNTLLGFKRSGQSIIGLTLNKDKTFSVSFDPTRPPQWLTPYGGTEQRFIDRVNAAL